MDRENKKRVTPDLDEEALMNLMVDGVKKEGLQPPAETLSTELPEKEKPVKKERSRSKGISTAEYEEIFFKEVKSTARHGKSVYINPDHHKKLSRIIQVIGDDNITIYAYLSNLLDHHFKEFEHQITESFNEKNTPIL
ncbi:DUF3408 domain-containing protein [Myroides odoratimimus]|uniref:Conjugal transfer protein TraB n=1 Tax=Myroides odoratimimus TaxID=76832 RepID=A0AAI8C8M8_9FLAO|nr:DUF3408 domain-containing protein [Myroides odoratimimus]ALU28154.1 conjugal transfer protein TraB [Myroides odoratimimus]MDM1038447.1 DUF3408 domain-containing protein [Myroides odoratimimus]MDM1052580.1 DUF3408 domain-containing protein [Myroides odoratimimus]MDM1067003.1 DUF3408 domain-containing protein [Myroides odoratimimus]MDM1460379.1 DUF3408 domain-containing protein [Myroides odoratimimus]